MSNIKYYAGVGSRETPELYLEAIRKTAGILGGMGFILRSGAADGADKAFEQGADDYSHRKEIWIPWRGFKSYSGLANYPTADHYDMAKTVHPAWEYLSEVAKALHARNTGQILGKDLMTPVEFVLCWTKDQAQTHTEVSRSTGGTGTAIKLASLNAIPVINLARQGAIKTLKELLSTST